MKIKYVCSVFLAVFILFTSTSCSNNSLKGFTDERLMKDLTGYDLGIEEPQIIEEFEYFVIDEIDVENNQIKGTFQCITQPYDNRCRTDFIAYYENIDNNWVLNKIKLSNFGVFIRLEDDYVNRVD